MRNRELLALMAALLYKRASPQTISQTKEERAAEIAEALLRAVDETDLAHEINFDISR